MKLVANIQLTPTAEQAKSLRDSLERCSAGCNMISQRGFEAGPMRKHALQKLVYRQLREEFGLTAQAAIRRIVKVADAYTTQKATESADQVSQECRPAIRRSHLPHCR